MTLVVGTVTVCEPSSGGLVELHLANVDDVASFTLTGEDYSAVVMSGGAVFFKFQFEQDTAEFRESVANEGGAISITKQIEFFVKKMSSLKRKALQDLINASTCGVIAIAKDANGLEWVVGYTENQLLLRPMMTLSDEGTTGKAFTDLNGNTVTIQSIDNEKARVFTGSIPV